MAIAGGNTNQQLNGVSKVTDEIKLEQTEALTDDSLAYAQAQAQAQETGVQADDPLAAIRELRLGQLAVCRLKSEEEMQAMREKLQGQQDDTADE